MIVTYSHPGGSGFQYAHYAKKDAHLADAWWTKIHFELGPCAPGGREDLTDREAIQVRYQDGTHVYAREVSPGRMDLVAETYLSQQPINPKGP